MLHPHSNGDPILSLPWEMILGLCTFGEILTIRSVSHGLREVVTNAISSEVCFNFLKDYMKEQNVYYIPDLEQWKSAATQTNIESIFSKDSTVYLDSLLQVLRVIKYLPFSMAVAFDTKHGRHCLPLQWNISEQRSEFMTFSSSRGNQPDCPKFKTKPRLRSSVQTTSVTSTSSNSPRNVIYDHLEMRDEHGQPLDLQTCSNTSVTNIPDDLMCPVCRETDYRTLVLSEFSYECDPGSVDERPSHVQLSWTPGRDGDVSRKNEEGTIEKKEQTKSKTIHTFPPMEEDMAIPIRSHPLSLKRDCKFAISMHCIGCRKFGVFSPASVCWSQSFCCAERGRTSGDKIIGGVMVRQKCSNSECNRPVSCPQCAHSRAHKGYVDENGESRPYIRQSHCDTCKLTFCDEDAWVSNVCHHW